MTSVTSHGDIVAYIDGGARGNPGPAGYGVRIEQSDGTLVEEFGDSIGIATNNVAEYRGLLAALEYALTHGYRRVHIRSDSLLLVQQMLGKYKVKHEGLQTLHAKARLLANEIGRVTFEHVGRSSNAHADRLANAAMDVATGREPRNRDSAPPQAAGGEQQHAMRRDQPKAATGQQPATSDQPPATSNQRPTTSNSSDPLSRLERAVRTFVFRHFAETARAPSMAEICSGTGGRELEVIGALHRLADLHALVLAPATTTIWMAHPFSAVATMFPVVARGRTYFANCAWDAAGILSLVGDGESITQCDDCGAELTFAVRGGTLHGNGVVHFAVPPTRFWDNVAFT